MYKLVYTLLSFIVPRYKGSRNATRIVPGYFHLSCEEKPRLC